MPYRAAGRAADRPVKEQHEAEHLPEGSEYGAASSTRGWFSSLLRRLWGCSDAQSLGRPCTRRCGALLLEDFANLEALYLRCVGVGAGLFGHNAPGNARCLMAALNTLRFGGQVCTAPYHRVPDRFLMQLKRQLEYRQLNAPSAEARWLLPSV
ncbi:hypothetical protein VFPBJ_11719 [Purpureocillium lilacinum]|uniref:Uncharacterized protein n=1 Tax=Purpureocillium lilacinum TaxID=33203 RepID=A0A179EXK9_PURLI|nr:hypothetical protein VFPBJ_11719 [Purpureocillium lilacinum]